jgi:tRNA-dihydrouridine synthase B
MAGVSESPFRRLCRALGADVVVTEFLSAEGIRRENEATISKLRFGADERPIGVQIFGADPAAMREAAALVTDVFQPEFIDINFGCPVKKVVKRNGGSGCLRDLDLVQMSSARWRGTHLPVTVQDPQRLERGDARPGEDRAALPGRGGPRARAAPAHAHADVHRRRALGRDRGGEGRAGDPGDRQRRHQDGGGRVRMHRETGCDGMMIARGSFGQPWIFTQARAMLEGAPGAGDAGRGGALRASRSSTRAWCRSTRPIPRVRRSSSASTSAGT